MDDKDGSAASWTTAGDTTGTSCIVTGLTSGTTYSFTVQCISPGESSYDTDRKSIQYLTAGKIVSLTNTAKGVKLKWKKITGTSTTVSKLRRGKKYYVRIRTYKKNPARNIIPPGAKQRA